MKLSPVVGGVGVFFSTELSVQISLTSFGTGAVCTQSVIDSVISYQHLFSPCRVCPDMLSEARLDDKVLVVHVEVEVTHGRVLY